MFIVSLVVCILLNVITVQPILGADDDQHKLIKKDQAEYNSQIAANGPIYSDSYTPKNNATASNDATKSVGNTTTGNVDKAKISGSHNRGIANTSIEQAPPSVSSNSNTNNTSNVKNSPQSSNIVKTSNPNANLSSATSIDNAAVISLNEKAVKKLNESMQKPAIVATTTKTSANSSTIKVITTTAKTTTTILKSSLSTTSAPKKPLITSAVEDIPGLLSKAAETQTPLSNEVAPIEETGNYGPLSLQSSETITYPTDKSSPNFVMTMIGIIVVIPFVIVVSNCARLKIRDYWSKRKYRRMNYLIEDMYN